MCKYCYSDNSEEIDKALKELDIPHDTSKPHRPQTNAVAERAVRRVKEGTSVTLDQSIEKIANWIISMGPKKFRYHLDLEIINDKTPETWTTKLI